MFLPLRLIWNLQRPTSQKAGIAGLFCVGWICITFATIRVVQIGVKAGNKSTPSSSWLALWAIVESAVAVMVGCCPGLYSKAKEVHSSRKMTSKRSNMPGQGGGNGHDSRGYQKHGTGTDDSKEMGFDSMASGGPRITTTVSSDPVPKSRSIEMRRIPSRISGGGAGTRFNSNSEKTSSSGPTNGTFWDGDDTSSQEGLNSAQKHIYVTNSIEIKDEEHVFNPRISHH